MTTNKTKLNSMVIAAMLAAVMCILGPISLPIGPVPISLTNMVIFFTVTLLGCKYGTISTAIYVLIGIAGLPVFSGYSGGMAKLMGPTGGFIVGFILLAFVSGFFIDLAKGKKSVIIFGLVLGAAIDYVCGTAWFVFLTKSSVLHALAICVFPFLIGDAIKIFIAVYAGEMLKARIGTEKAA